YPTEFFAALMTADKDKIEKVVRTIAEARAWGVSVLPPDVNASDMDFTVVYTAPEGNGPPRGPGRLRDRYRPQIRFGLGAVRGLGARTAASRRAGSATIPRSKPGIGSRCSPGRSRRSGATCPGTRSCATGTRLRASERSRRARWPIRSRGPWRPSPEWSRTTR